MEEVGDVNAQGVSDEQKIREPGISLPALIPLDAAAFHAG
jgi:hypothetical protein